MASSSGLRYVSCMSRLIAALWWVGLAAGQTLLFDGKSLEGWKQTPFTGQGEVRVEEGTLVLGPGKPMTGITWTGSFPRSSYEVRFEAMGRRATISSPALRFRSGTRLPPGYGRLGRRHRGHLQHRRMGRIRQRDQILLQFRKRPMVCASPAGDRRPIQAWIDEQPIVNVDIAGRNIGLRMARSSCRRRSASRPTRRPERLRKIEYRALDGLAVKSPAGGTAASDSRSLRSSW